MCVRVIVIEGLVVLAVPSARPRAELLPHVVPVDARRELDAIAVQLEDAAIGRALAHLLSLEQQ
jgi:hypothetical protein